MADLEKPNKNIQLFLFLLHRLGTVKGRIKLYKIHYLIEREGKVKYDLPICNFPLGPVDYVSADFCTENGLVSEELKQGLPHDYYDIRLTPKGRRYFDKVCVPLIKHDEKKKAEKIIDKYRGQTATQILNHVHAQYVDGFKSKAKTLEIIGGFENNLPVYRNLIERNIKEGLPAEEEDKLYCAIEYLYHIEGILKSLGTVADPVKRGQVLCTIKELFEALKENKYRANAYSMELFDYLDNYCEKEEIFHSIADDDFSDIPKGVRERLLKTIAQMEVPLSS